MYTGIRELLLFRFVCQDLAVLCCAALSRTLVFGGQNIRLSRVVLSDDVDIMRTAVKVTRLGTTAL